MKNKLTSILYCEDDIAVVKELTEILKEYCDILYTANNGQDGFELYKKHHPTLVITDIRMPVMDGLKLIEKIREVDIEQKIYVTSAHGENDYFIKAIDLQVDSYIMKPIDLDKLISKLEVFSKEEQYKKDLIAELNEKNNQLASALETLKAQEQILSIHNAELTATNDELYKANILSEDMSSEYKVIVDNLEYPFIICDQNLHIQKFNESAVQHFIINKNLHSQHLLSLIVKSETEKILTYIDNKEYLNNQHIIISMKTRNEVNSTDYKIKITNHPVNIDWLMFIFVNTNYEYTLLKEIKNNKQKDKILIEQSKMSSMGEMIANIAHQWRQPLNIIGMTTSGIRMQKEFDALTDEFLMNSLDAIDSNMHYLSDTIDTFRNFIKGDSTLKETLIQDEIKQCKNLVESILKNKFIQLKDNINYDDPVMLVITPGELPQVLINIINNAKDIIVEKNITDPWIELNMKHDEKTITLTIEDNAGGIPQDVLPHIFEPYYTTKHKSQGTGLGLYMSYKIINDSFHGKLYAQNTQNGAKFIIEIPKEY